MSKSKRVQIDGEDFYPVTEAAKVAGVTRNWLYTLVRDRQVRGTQISGLPMLIAESELGKILFQPAGPGRPRSGVKSRKRQK
jgi:hypothetical protein